MKIMYSEDLKIRAINIYNLFKSYRKVENLLNISKSTIHRWVTDSVKKITNCKIKNVIIDKDLLVFNIKSYLDKNKFITIRQIKHKLYKKFKKTFSSSLIYIIITKTLKYSYKKVNNRLFGKSLNILKQKRIEFMKTLKNINTNKIVSIDETYLYSNYNINYGWAKKGTPVIHYKKANPIKYSIIMAITNKKIIKTDIHKCNINKTSFIPFISELNNLLKNHYFLLDNVSFHKMDDVKKLFVNSSNKLLYIPPYSPEFNPIVLLAELAKPRQRLRRSIFTN